MSHAVESLVRRNSSLKRSAKAVLLAIAHYANDEGKSAYPAIRTIARDTGLTNRGVQKAIKQAVKAGELKRFHNFGPHGVNHYEVRIDQLQSKRLQATRSQTRPLPPNSVHPRTQFAQGIWYLRGAIVLRARKRVLRVATRPSLRWRRQKQTGTEAAQTAEVGEGDATATTTFRRVLTEPCAIR